MRKVVGIIQARMGSERLPGKSVMDLCGKPVLEHVIRRVKRARTLDAIVLAAPDTSENDVLENLARELGIEVFRGSENDVLNRYVEAARVHRADVVVRITADNPLIAPEEIDRIVTHHLKTGADYSFNIVPRMGNNYPDGLGAEAVNYPVLEKIDRITRQPAHREHVTAYIWDRPADFHIETIQAPPRIAGPEIKLDVDTIEDFKHLESLIGALPPDPEGLWSAQTIVKTYREHFGEKVLILLEHEAQVKDCAEWLGDIGGQKLVIALTPFAIYELEKRGMPCRVPEDYYGPDELLKLSENNYQTVENICDVIDSRLRNACTAFVETALKPALFSIHHLKMAYDAVTVQLFQLLKIAAAEKPDVIFTYATRSYPFGIPQEAQYLLFDNRESIQAHLLALPVGKTPAVMLPHIEPPEELRAQPRDNRPGRTLKSGATRWLMSHHRLLTHAIAFRKSGWRGLASSLTTGWHANKSETPLLLGGEGYSWDNCEQEFRQAGIGPFLTILDDLKYWLDRASASEPERASLKMAWEELKVNAEFRGLFTYGDSDFFPIMEARIRFLVEQLPLAYLRAYQEMSRLLKRRRIAAVLAKTLGAGTTHAAAQAAHNLSIPVVVWQHGSCGYMYQPMAIYNDLMNADAEFVFGEGVVEHYAKSAERFGTRLVPVGSAALDTLTEEVDSPEDHRSQCFRVEGTKKVILYVVPDFARNNVYISLSPPYSDDLCWRTQRGILDVLARHDDYTAVVKLHSNPISRNNLLEHYAKEKSFKNCLFVTDQCSFKDLLPLADVVVIDFPMTTLLEALTTTKPLFVYTGRLHIDDKALKLLERRAYCHQKLADFLDALDRFLSDGGVNTEPVDLNNKDFLKRYGTDGASAARAAAALKEIITSYKGKRLAARFSPKSYNNKITPVNKE